MNGVLRVLKVIRVNPDRRVKRASPDPREKRVSLALKATRVNVAKREKLADLRDLPGLQDQPVLLVQVHQQRHKSRRRHLGLRRRPAEP